MSKTSRLPAHSEHELVAAIRTGNDRAFEELYARYRERIFSFILSKVHDHGRAEDVAQEVFMSALRRLRGSDQTIAFKPWIYEIAKNACIDEFRRGGRAREVPLESDGEFVVDRQQASVSGVPTPPAAVESKQRLHDLRGAFGGLSTTHHQLLVMREFEGMSYDEIGERLDMTRQMVESSLFRARRKLSEEYQELASGQRCEQIQTAIDGGRLRAVSALGVRDRRRFARHLAHCQPCRHAALMAGVDETLVKPRSIAAKIAAFLPFPLWRLPWGSKGAKAASTGGSHHLAGTGSAGLVPSAGSALTFGQAAATVAVIIAGAGGGLAVHGLSSGGHSHHAAATKSAQHQASSTTGSSGASSSAAAAKAAHSPASLTSAPVALRFTGSQHASTQPLGTGGGRRGSAPGAPGSGTAGGGSGSSTSAPKQGTAGSRPTASGAATKVVNGVTTTVDGLGKTVAGAGKTVDGVTNGVNKTVQNVTGGVGKTVNTVTKTVGKVTGGVGNTVSTATGGAVDPSQAVGTVNKVVNGVGNGVSNTGSKLVNGVAGGATGTVQKVASPLTGASNTVPPSSSGASGSTPSTPSAPSAPATSTGSAGSGASGAVTQPLKSGLQQAGGLLGK
ncbi:MAG TPA: sigma-70 family RNA polymerase sigma factor [Solirubrobacteraceae bacterium]|nr:sigma-70 family RNA polymerase sigma factor [Solirubrobacteraceae bacterium]